MEHSLIYSLVSPNPYRNGSSTTLFDHYLRNSPVNWTTCDLPVFAVFA